MSGRYVLALDQGTTIAAARSSSAATAARSRRAQQEFPQIFPQPGRRRARSGGDLVVAARRWRARRWHAPELGAADIAAIGITNQRETTVLWERDTGQPVANAIVWQSRVSAPHLRAAEERTATRTVFRAQDRPGARRLLLRARRSSTCSTRSPACARARRRARCCSAPSTRSSSGGSPAAACT